MDKDFSELVQYLDEKFGKVDSRLGEVDSRFGKIDSRFGKIDSRFDKIDSRFGEVDSMLASVGARIVNIEARIVNLEVKVIDTDQKIDRIIQEKADKKDINNLMTVIDSYAKKADAYFQEMVVLSHKVARLEKWLQQIADKVGIKLDY